MDTRESGPKSRALSPQGEKAAVRRSSSHRSDAAVAYYAAPRTPRPASPSPPRTPFEDNGVKFSDTRMKIPDAVEEQIGRRVACDPRESVRSGDRHRRQRRVIERYERFLDDGVAPDALADAKSSRHRQRSCFRIAPEVFAVRAPRLL